MGLSRILPVWRIALVVFIVASILWLGGTHARMLLANDLLKTGTLEMAEYIPPEAEREVYHLMSVTAVMVVPAYAAAVISSIVFLALSPYRPKRNGWLMMSAILFYLFVPVEAYTMTLDARMVYQEFFTTADNHVFRELFLARVGALGGAPVIAMLSYYTIIILAVVQPMKRREEALS